MPTSLRPVALARLAALVIGGLWCRSPALAQELPDYSGVWIANTSKIEVVARQDRTPGGWSNLLAGLRQPRAYAVTIEQTPTAVSVRFPGTTFLNVDPYRLDQVETTYVKNMGDYWRKTVTSSGRTGEALTLSSRALVGWWKDARPQDVVRQDTELTTTQVLALGRDGETLIVETTVADEKGMATYRMVFVRAGR